MSEFGVEVSSNAVGSVSVSNAATAAAAAAKAVKSQDRKLKGKADEADKVTLDSSNDPSKNQGEIERDFRKSQHQ